MKVCECQNCGKEFETDEEEVKCPFCHSEDVILYEEEE